MNKYEIKYMLESEQSKTDRLIDIIGKDKHLIDDFKKNEEHKNNSSSEQQTEIKNRKR